MKRSNVNRNRSEVYKFNLLSYIRYYRRKLRENRKGVINHIRKDRKVINTNNDDLN
jgi:hypothetical protein